MSILEDPLSSFTGAIETVVGWSCAYLTTWCLGYFIGLGIGSGEFGDVLLALLLAPLALLFSVFKNPNFIFSFVAFLGLWALPLYLDLSRSRIVFLLLALGAALLTGYAITTVHFM